MSAEDTEIVRRVAGLESDMQNVKDSIGKLTDVVQQLTNKISTETKTNWGVLGTWAAIIIGVMSSLGYLATKPFEIHVTRERQANVRQWDRLHELENRFEQERVVSGEGRQKLMDLENEVNRIRDEQTRRTQRVYRMKETKF